MSFCSLTFLIFLPLVFAIHWFMPTRKWQNLVLLVASFVFYGWWSVPFLCLMLGTCIISFCLSRIMLRFKEYSRGVLILGIVLDISILGVFKYYDFFVTEFCDALKVHAYTLNVIIPVGVSFYTFQLLGYLIDVFRNRDNGNDDCFLDFLTFITFFPQLVAGPIERREKLMSQFTRRRIFNFNMAREGMRLILWGIVKKMLVADICAEYVNNVFGNIHGSSMTTLWVGALCFTFQIYGDFSGYSDIAIGCAKLFGIHLSRNFCLPYFSSNIRDFWHRWHMTLMSWFKDYVYIPLGGSHCSRWKKTMNTLIVFGLSGLWHGANWTYIAWGLYHGIIMCFSQKSYLSQRYIRIEKFAGGFITFIVVLIGWVIFRSMDITTAKNYISGMFDVGNGYSLTLSKKPLVVICLLVSVEMFMGKGCMHPFVWRETGLLSKQYIRLPVYAIVFTAVLFWGGESSAFIYFQF